MKNSKKVLMLGLILSMVFVLGACGKETNTLEEVKESGELSFAMTAQYPPFNFSNDDGEIVGFDIDIAKEIAERLGVEAKPITAEWDGILTGLMGGNFDTVIGSMAITPEREEQVSFSRPYYYDDAQLFTKEETEVEDISEFEDGNIGVVVGTTFEKELLDMENINVKSYQGDVDNIRDLEFGRLDGLITAKLVGLYNAAKDDIDMEPVGEPLYREEIGIAIRKDDDELLQAINDALEDMVEDGTYKELSEKWFEYDMTDEIE
ncbi:MAG: transporter substrate-binding domain-containing protein [Tissierella sp.]|uniref:transporter substrate-binding domain-containing protein n=1 Tax=Tissierella sp. TaxID=41274 RepID=UPI003F971E5A